MNNKWWFFVLAVLFGFIAGWILKPIGAIDEFPSGFTVYFSKIGPTGTEMIGVDRVADPLVALATIAVQSILTGPTGSEQKQGLVSSINVNTKLNYVRINNGVAFVDFNSEFDANIAGSTKVLAIFEQINKTLTFFPGINEVRLSVDFETRPAVLEP